MFGGPMRRLSLTAVAAASTVAFTQIASAADLPRKSPVYAPPSPVYNWTGFYVGANAGGAWGRDNVSTTGSIGAGLFAIDNAAVTSAASPTIDPTGFTGGIQLGYNWQTGNVVWGIEGDFDYLG